MKKKIISQAVSAFFLLLAIAAVTGYFRAPSLNINAVDDMEKIKPGDRKRIQTTPS